MKRGSIISFTGYDGTGKSTQVKLLMKYLKNRRFKVHATEEMFGYFLLKPLIASLRVATSSPSLGPVRRNKNPLFKLWFTLAFIDIWLKHFFKIRPMLLRYNFIIADRFYPDLWANLLYYGYLPKWAFITFLKLLPRVDKQFFLSVNQNIVQKREREFPPEYYKEQSLIYNNLPKYISSFIVIDASKDPKMIFKDVIKYLSL